MSYDVTTRLQNHPGSLAMPTHKAFGEKSAEERHRKRTQMVSIIVLCLCVAAAAGALILAGVQGDLRMISYVLVGGSIGGILAVLRENRPQNGAAAKEQKRYYAVTGVKPLTDEQRAAMRLDAFNSFANGCWCETLEEWPSERRLEDAGGDPESFTRYDILTRDFALRSLDSDWGVISADGYRKMVGRLFAGMHSHEFLEAFGFDADASVPFRTRVAELVGVDVETVEAQLRPTAHGPAPFVWAFDLWRVTPMSRTAYAAGLIDEDEAWANILKASSWLRALFPTLEAYYANLRLGHAFWSGDLAAVQERRRMIEDFETETEYTWPIRDVAWTDGPAAELPEFVRTGFEDEVARSIRERDGAPPDAIGFQLPPEA